jgi:LPS sulfotransferase NodH
MAPGELRFQARHLGRLVHQRVARDQLSPVRFVIFGRGRSGSTTLVSLLDSQQHVQCDDEILRRRVLFPRQHVQAMCARSHSPVYGCKILSYQVSEVQPLRRREEFVRDLTRDGFRVLHLTRDNVVEHAVSNIRARQLGFHRASADPAVDRRVTVARDELMHWIEQSEALARFEDAALAGVPHLALTYESALAHESLQQTTLQRVCAYLDLPQPAPGTRSRFAKISPPALRESVANYDQLVGFLRGTPYARWLPEH